MAFGEELSVRSSRFRSKSMQNTSTFNTNLLLADKTLLRRIVAEQGVEMGLEYDPAITPADSRRLILEDGVKPEDNLFSCGIVQTREE